MSIVICILIQFLTISVYMLIYALKKIIFIKKNYNKVYKSHNNMKRIDIDEFNN